MANSPYHKLGNGWQINIAEPGGPSIWRVEFDDSVGSWFVRFSYDGANFLTFPNPFPTAAQAQTNLDNVIAQINGGTFGP